MKKRPINLNLFSIRFPITAIVSILHRLSGVFLFLIIPWLLWGLECSLSDSSGLSLKQPGSAQGFKLFIWLILSSLFYHLFAGLRHLIMDMGWGESLGVARVTAKAVLVLSLVYSMGLGIWLWF